jgi:hypothetical protein
VTLRTSLPVTICPARLATQSASASGDGRAVDDAGLGRVRGNAASVRLTADDPLGSEPAQPWKALGAATPLELLEQATHRRPWRG